MIHLFTSKTERREGASKTDTKYRRLHFRGERTTIQRSIYVKNRHNIGWPDTRNIVKAFCIYYCERVGVLFPLICLFFLPWIVPTVFSLSQSTPVFCSQNCLLGVRRKISCFFSLSNVATVQCGHKNDMEDRCIANCEVSHTAKTPGRAESASKFST